MERCSQRSSGRGDPQVRPADGRRRSLETSQQEVDDPGEQRNEDPHPYVDGKPRYAGVDSFLRSRGIEESEARRLVVHGFFNDLIRKVGVPSIEDRLLTTVEAELAKNVLKDPTTGQL